MSEIQSTSPLTKSPHSIARLARRRLTIALFGSVPGGELSYEKWQLWRGVVDTACKLDVNLIYVAGNEFQNTPQAVIYRLMGAHNIDGIISWNTFVSAHSTDEAQQEFFSHFKSVPLISLERTVEGSPSILLDNLQGMTDLIQHLSSTHGYRKIAYLLKEGSFPNHLRADAFNMVMEEFGLLDPALVGSLEELDARGLIPGRDYQAMVVHGGRPAVNLVDVFRSRGLRVPDDIAVVAFDDGRESRACMPALTTVRLPLRQMGVQGVEMMVKMLHGEEVPEQVNLPMRLILRRSCGCLEPLAQMAFVGPVERLDQTLQQGLAEIHDDLVMEMSQGMGSVVSELDALAWAGQLLDRFTAELFIAPSEANHDDFLRFLMVSLEEVVDQGVNINRFHEAYSTMRRRLLPYLRGAQLERAEDLMNMLRVITSQVATRVEVNRGWQAATSSRLMREIDAHMLTAGNTQEMLTVLARALPKLGVRRCYLSLYEDPANPHGWARMVMAYQNGVQMEIEPEGLRFQARSLVPKGWLAANRRTDLLVVALNFLEEQLGFVVFEAAPPIISSDLADFDALQTKISSALKVMHLLESLNLALQKAEEANVLKSRFLSMVSHELRTPINLIVGLSEMALRQQQRGGNASMETMRKFQEQIYVSGQHLDRLIRDVLDLASSQVGKMDLVREPLDLAPVLRDAAIMGLQLAEQKKLRFIQEIPDYLPQVYGDKTRLRQVVLNLLSNAVKFTAHGEVALTASLGPDDILITVRDSGLGIPLDEQEKIFDEFQRSERTAGRGYGGMGLGLAITRRLVEMHGGRIWVTSAGEEGSGSTFSLTIPVLSSEVASQLKPADAFSGTVLVLTGSAGDSQELMEHLAHQGFVVDEMALDEHPNPLELLYASPPGAVVLDMAPASEQGWNIIRALKRNPATNEIPVLFYSLVAECDSGAVVEMEYLTKPVGAVELVKALERHGLKQDGRGSSSLVLIVDDDPAIQDLHKRMVKMELPSARVMTASNGRIGLDMMRKNTPDLVLLDLIMPELDGFGVLKVMQEEQRLSSIPVIVLSAQELTDREMKKLNHNVASVLAKGLFSSRETLDRINIVLSRSKRLGSEGQRLVRQAMAYIHDHYKDPIMRADIANSLSINEQYLSRCFNKEIGISPMAYLNRYRILQARKLLEIGELSITQVALEVGISSQSYFSRIFQQETGVTPTAYQRGSHPPVRD